ncbi:MAG: NAD-binding protein [Thiolinea sp.]
MPNIFFILLRRLRKPLLILIVIYAVSMLGFVLIPGRDDQGNVWYMSFFHAFYFVSYMATTIGFGEIPYAFTDGQRLWAMLTIYAGVVGWLYSIGALLTVLQDPAFRQLRSEYSFRHKVRQLHTPFYLVCGYGDTGAILVQALADEGIVSVVIDQDDNRIQELVLNDYVRHPLGIAGDASNPKVLEGAGVLNPYCLGVIALTDTDRVNLMVALAVHLLNPGLRFLARADSTEAVANIRSFGKNEVINPFETFAGRMAMALDRPGHYMLFEWMTGVPNEPLQELGLPHQGSWIICGYGRFGQALDERMQRAGIQTVVIESKPPAQRPVYLIEGYGTGADTLLQAGIKEAAGIIAGTDNDANNLSILLTARELNREVFTVARQNNRANALIFEQANFDLIMKRGDVVAHKIFALLRTPLLNDFLNLAGDRDGSWANLLLSRILGVTDELEPHLWELKVTEHSTPALYHACLPGHERLAVRLQTLLRDPAHREQVLRAIPLLLKREGAVLLLPAEETELRVNDRILMCGTRQVRNRMDWAAQNEAVLHYLLTGEDLLGSSWFWRWWRERFSRQRGEKLPDRSP